MCSEYAMLLVKHSRCAAPLGMNTVIVLLMLLLAVPLQLFLSHYINTAYAVSFDAESVDPGAAESPTENVRGDINAVRMEALHR